MANDSLVIMVIEQRVGYAVFLYPQCSNLSIMTNTNQNATCVVIRDLRYGLEDAISFLNDDVFEEAITDLSLFLDDCKGADEVLATNVSRSILKLYSNVCFAKKELVIAYKSLTGEEVSHE